MDVDSIDPVQADRASRINALRRSLPPGATTAALLAAEARLDRATGCASRLAVYGTLAPGGDNHGLLRELGGRWSVGHVRGVRFVGRQGSAEGYPALALDPRGEAVRVDVLESSELPAAYGRLDTFEGDAYRRVIVPVRDRHGAFLAFANVYEAVEEPPERSAAT